MKQRSLNAANILTGLRIVFALLLMFFPAFSVPFYAFYLLGGFTDAIDGTVARRTGTETEFGAKLDTAADIVFALAAVIRIAGALVFSVPLLIWIGIIIMIKAAGIAAGFIKQRRFVTVHSTLNRICGLAAFIAPLLIGIIPAFQSGTQIIIAVCVIASAAAVCEFIKILSGES